MGERLAWNDPALLRDDDDSPLRSRYRRLQSWYRDQILDADYGTSRGRPAGNRLSEDAVTANPDLNFYSPQVARFAEETAARVRRDRGSLDPVRLRHNMLSSMPLCFNLFGALRAEHGLAQLLRDSLEVPVAEIEEVLCEWAPPPAEALDDRTAFDAFVRYKTPDGKRGFLGIETKYTEPFSEKRYPPNRYAAQTGASGWFKPEAADALASPLTNQLWRNVLLATTLLRAGQYDEGWAVVLTLQADERAKRARTLLDRYLTPDARIRWVSYEELVPLASEIASLQRWAAWFNRRYLDLAPVAAASGT